MWNWISHGTVGEVFGFGDGVFGAGCHGMGGLRFNGCGLMIDGWVLKERWVDVCGLLIGVGVLRKRRVRVCG